MSEDLDRSGASKKAEALKKLADHLAALSDQDQSTLPMESDMLSLIVSGTLNGENISQRYPAFYRKLLENAALRQAFLDAVESVESERAGQMVPLPVKPETNLAFLTRKSSAPILELFDTQKWRATWERTLEQIQAIFSPQELAYRADLNLLEDPWFTLLREAMTVLGTTYDVVLDCTLSTDLENALSPFLNLAVTLGASSEPVQFPLRLSLQWGDYHESVLINAEGRARFPDIPLIKIFDPSLQRLQAGLNLTLETTS